MLVRDRILVALAWADLSYEETADIIGSTPGNVRSANIHNLDRQYVEWTSNPKNRAAGANLMRLTNAGRDRLAACMVRMG